MRVGMFVCGVGEGESWFRGVWCGVGEGEDQGEGWGVVSCCV